MNHDPYRCGAEWFRARNSKPLQAMNENEESVCWQYEVSNHCGNAQLIPSGCLCADCTVGD